MSTPGDPDLLEISDALGEAAERALPIGAAPLHRQLAWRLALLRHWLAGQLAREWDRGRGFLWLPVAFGAGILAYFGLPREPWLPALVAMAVVLCALAFVLRRRRWGFVIAVGLAAIAFGLVAMKVRTDSVAAPIMPAERTVTVTGHVIESDRLGANGTRLVIRVATISGLKPAETPRNIRVTVSGGAKGIVYGDGVSLRARLRPPDGPPLPGGYDFAETSFFQSLGASGFALGAPTKAEVGEPPLSVRLLKPLADLRRAIGQRIEEALPGEHGRVAVALIVGDQGGISDDTIADLRNSGLAHILSISGLHMVLVAGAVFWVLRAFLALIPSIALRYPIKQWSAAAALLVATLYLGLSGAAVPTQRSYVMLAIMLVAVLLGRRAMSLRNVALAALVVLVFTPESLITASFQMSFAAAAALVSAFEAWSRRDRTRLPVAHTLMNRVLREVGVMAMTSLVAGLATTPFAAFHFQRLAPLSFLANLIATPAISFVVMPMALAAVVLMPFGLESFALDVMAWGLEAVRIVAAWVAGLSAGMGGVPKASVGALLVVIAGFLWLVLWSERWRWLGVAPILLGIYLGVTAPRPDLFIAPDGRFLATRGSDGVLHIVGNTRGGFVVENWLRADADPREDKDKSLGKDVRCDSLGCIGPLAASGEMVSLVRDQSAFGEDCRRAKIIVTDLEAPPRCGALVIDRKSLAAGGSHALYREAAADGSMRYRIETAYPERRRPFMPPVRQQQAP